MLLHRTALFTCCPRTLTLCVHRLFEAFFINRHLMIFRILNCQFEWETIRVIQTERIFATDDVLTVCFRILSDRVQDCKTVMKRLMETFFFVFNDAFDEVRFFRNLWVEVNHDVPDRINEFIHERTFDPKHLRITNRTA